MAVAGGTLAVETANREARIAAPGGSMQIDRARFQTGQAETGNPAHHAGQIGFDQGARQAEDFEIAAAAIGGDD